MQGSETGFSSCLDRRRAGILLHITSLPGDGPTGDLGAEARHFIDFLADSGMSVWQILPVGPTQADGSPYQTSSVHAGNPRLIDLKSLVDSGWLSEQAAREANSSDTRKNAALYSAWKGFTKQAGPEDHRQLVEFAAAQSFWLDDYALFTALHEEQRGPWWEWPVPLRDRREQGLAQARVRLADAIDYVKFQQYLFFTQWMVLKEYAQHRGIKLFGDVPIFVSHDSAEVWSNPQDFDLDEDRMPRVVAGVPPDYFSETGQRWGNPIYNWDRMREEGFSFWVDRFRTQLKLFDFLRIDHFRGFESYWEIPAHEEHAINGRWVEAPGDDLFDQLHETFDRLPLVAEDLGIITPAVEHLRRKYRLPGMKVLQFAFSGDPHNPYLPFNHGRNAVVYTGTHDNDTTLGWYTGLDDHARQLVDEYLGRSREVMPWPLIRCAMGSRAWLAVVPMQDVLGLDGTHRMNLPGTTEGNWLWRFSWDQVDQELSQRLRRRVTLYGRA